MKGTTIINFIKELNYDDYERKYELAPGIENNSYIIFLNIKRDDNLDDIINNKEEFNECLNISKEIYDQQELEPDDLEYYNINNKHIINLIDKSQNNEIDLLQESEYYLIKIPFTELPTYIEKNPLLKNKKIILNESFELGDKKIDIVKEILKDYIDNIYIRVEGNFEAITLTKYEKTIGRIEKIKEKIQGKNLSPIESLMYLYDLLKERIYKVDTNDKIAPSRDISYVLFDDHIVCSGYAQIFNALAKELGFNARTYLVDIDGEKHLRNLVYVKDPKYNINGLYYFDPTWDSKQDDKDTDYIYNYKYFAKTKEEIEDLTLQESGSYTYDETFKSYDIGLLKIVKELLEKDPNSLPLNIILTLNNMSNIIDNMDLIKNPYTAITYKKGTLYSKNISYNKELLFTKLAEYDKLMSKPLTESQLVDILYNVKKIQHYQEPYKYSFSLSDFYKTFINSGWYFSNPNHSRTYYNDDQISDYANELILYLNFQKNYSREIKRIKLTRTLKDLYNQKNK